MTTTHSERNNNSWPCTGSAARFISAIHLGYFSACSAARHRTSRTTSTTTWPPRVRCSLFLSHLLFSCLLLSSLMSAATCQAQSCRDDALQILGFVANQQPFHASCDIFDPAEVRVSRTYLACNSDVSRAHLGLISRVSRAHLGRTSRDLVLSSYPNRAISRNLRCISPDLARISQVLHNLFSLLRGNPSDDAAAAGCRCLEWLILVNKGAPFNTRMRNCPTSAHRPPHVRVRGGRVTALSGRLSIFSH